MMVRAIVNTIIMINARSMIRDHQRVVYILLVPIMMPSM